jgi:hypothetical protein
MGGNWGEVGGLRIAEKLAHRFSNYDSILLC